jgi:hypothetical protein
MGCKAQDCLLAKGIQPAASTFLAGLSDTSRVCTGLGASRTAFSMYEYHSAGTASRPSPLGACGALDPVPAAWSSNQSRRRCGKPCSAPSYNLVDGNRGHVSLAFLTAALVLFSFVRERADGGYALASVGFLYSSGFLVYATQARLYSLMLMFFSVAFLCWIISGAVSFCAIRLRCGCSDSHLRLEVQETRAGFLRSPRMDLRSHCPADAGGAHCLCNTGPASVLGSLCRQRYSSVNFDLCSRIVVQPARCCCERYDFLGVGPLRSSSTR